jgi:predicted nucleic acid-binding protein
MKYAKTFEVLWGSDESNRIALDILAHFHLSHGIGFLDSLQAAVAWSSGLILVTDNVKHFRIVPGLIVKTPMEVLQGRKEV